MAEAQHGYYLLGATAIVVGIAGLIPQGVACIDGLVILAAIIMAIIAIIIITKHKAKLSEGMLLGSRIAVFAMIGYVIISILIFILLVGFTNDLFQLAYDVNDISDIKVGQIFEVFDKWTMLIGIVSVMGSFTVSLIFAAPAFFSRVKTAKVIALGCTAALIIVSVVGVATISVIHSGIEADYDSDEPLDEDLLDEISAKLTPAWLIVFDLVRLLIYGGFAAALFITGRSVADGCEGPKNPYEKYDEDPGMADEWQAHGLDHYQQQPQQNVAPPPKWDDEDGDY